MTKEEQKLAYHISVKGMIVNLGLFAAKGVCGLLIHSVSLLSDAVHSLTDIFSTLVVLIGLKVSVKPADKEHPYGHERIECIIAFLLGIMLFGIGGIIGYEGYEKMRFPVDTEPGFTVLNIVAAGSAVLSIVFKEWMFRFTMKCAKKIGSPSMAADAWHHRSDAISSIGSLAGVIGICTGYAIIDVLACFVISLFIFKAAYDICKDACRRMIDTSADSVLIEKMRSDILQNDEVLSVDVLKTRQFGSKLYVDIEITLESNLSFIHSHETAHLIHDKLENDFPEIKHCMIHVNPSA
ncbi:MAG: cation diffusion facilitator family transporter [Oscillospiraceae bacterium]|nr:cation diffusion facilitator family transporter [Oscillospiraceae bacterium]